MYRYTRRREQRLTSRGGGGLDEELDRIGSMGAGVEGMLDDLSAHGADDEDGSINSPSPDKTREGVAVIKTSALD